MEIFKLILFVVAGLLINLFYILLISIRYKYFLKVLGDNIGIKHSFYLFCISQTVNYLTPLKIGGVLIKPVATKWFSSINMRTSLVVAIFEQIFDLVWQVLFLIFAALFISNKYFSDLSLVNLVIFCILLIAATLPLLKADSIVSYMIKKLLKGKRFKAFTDISDVEVKKDLVIFFKNFKIFSTVLILTIIFVLFAPLLVYISLAAFGIYLSYVNVFFVYWVSFIIGRISGIPGGFGTRDVTMGALLLSYNVPNDLIIYSIIIYRIITMVPNLAIGGYFILVKGGKAGLNLFKNKKKL